MTAPEPAGPEPAAAPPPPGERLLAPDADEVVLRRLHPLTPLVRGWKIGAAGAVVVLSQRPDAFLSGDPAGAVEDAGVSALIAIALIPLAVLYAYLSWRFTRYGFDGGDLRIDSGVLFRQSRRVRLDRLQAVDVVQPVLARVLGLAELRLEVVGGASTEAPLAYLSLPDAHRLRAELLALAAGIAEDTPEAPERVMHVVPDPRLLASSLLQTSVVVGVAAVPVAVVAAVVVGEFGWLVFAVPAVLSIGAGIVAQFVANYGFTLAESPDGLRIRRGLLETRAQTVPPGRIQAVRLVEPWLWRAGTDWVRVEVDIAGYAGGSSGDSSAVLLPVAPRPLALGLLARVLPGADPAAIPTTGVPERAVWLAPLTRRVLVAGADGRYFLARRGLLRRETDVMPHERTQSVRATQGPVQRLLRLATITLDTTPGPVTVYAPHRDAAEALAMVRAQAERARVARAAAAPEQWMLGRPGSSGSPQTPRSPPPPSGAQPQPAYPPPPGEPSPFARPDGSEPTHDGRHRRRYDAPPADGGAA